MSHTDLKVRLLVAIFGAIPATVLCIPVFILFLSSADRVSQHELAGLAGILWGAAGMSGTVSAWLFVSGWSEKSVWRRWISITGIVIGAVALALLPMVYQVGIEFAWILMMAILLITAYFTIYLLLPFRKAVGITISAAPVFLTLLAGAGMPALSSEIISTRQVSWHCGDYDTCDKYFSYSFVDDEQTHVLVTESGLIRHLKMQPSSKVSAVFREHYVLGFYTGYELIEIGGYAYGNPNNNKRKLPVRN